MNIKGLLKVLVYLSLVFLIIYLYKNGLLIVPEIFSYSWLLLSLLFLFIGFLVDAWGWQTIINQQPNKVNYKTALISNGLYIFTKYLPGKVWIILGRAGFLRAHTQFSLAELGGLSFIYQVIILAAGMTIGLSGILIIGFEAIVIFFAFLFMLLSLIIIFSGLLNKTASWVSSKFFKKQFKAPKIPSLRLLHVFLISIVTWMCWSIGFYLYVISITPVISLNPVIGMGFPFATVWGVVAVFAPGGLGIREGILTGYLKLTSLQLEYATTVSFFSRIWFLSGEIFIFMLAVLLKSFKSK